MPRDSKGKPILYKPFKNPGKGFKKFHVYVKSDNKKGYKKILHNIKMKKEDHHI